MSDHLDFDTDFLDKDTPQKTGATSYAKSLLGKNKYNWKKILIIGGIILFFGWAIFSNSGSSSTPSSNSTYTPPANNDLTTGTGRTFRCSDYNYSRALALRPNAFTVTSLASESNALDSRTSALKIQHTEIDAMYVDKTDQSSLDSYNTAVDDFNAKNDQLKLDVANWNQRNTALNSQIDTFNNFLDTNCTPQ